MAIATLEFGDFFWGGSLLIGFLSSIIFVKKKTVGGQSFLILTFALLFSYIIDILGKYGAEDRAKAVLIAFYLGGTVATTSLLFFVFQYTSRLAWVRFPRLVLFLAEPIISILIILRLPTDIDHHGSLFHFLAPSSLFWFWHYIHFCYIILLLLLATIIIAPRASLEPGGLRRKSMVLLIASLLPLLPLFFEISNVIDSFSPQMFAFTLSSIMLGAILLPSKTIDIMPISRNRVVEQMSDGWILLDSTNRVVDTNPAAGEILAFSKYQVYGKDAKEIFSSWPNVLKALESGQNLDAKSSSTASGEVLFLHIRIFSVKNATGVIAGRQILLRDYTDRRMSELARQEARDEMFSLLHSISGAASRSENINEFITASMYQLAYSFNCETTSIFLNERDVDDDRFLLVAHQGIQAKYVENLSFLDRRYKLISEISDSKQSLLIDDVQVDWRTPDHLRAALTGCLLLIPIIADDEFVGLILLTREKQIFGDDEIARLEIAAEQVGSFVRSDRRRHIVSILAERQRLIRDLHDSVTQRLYALVMTTEAAKLALTSGKKFEPGEVITLLGSNARQALKEMRLFLYKLQPINLEQEGLAAVLIRRLEAVEGRAGLEKKIDVTDNIVFTPEEELSLFLITQEALNNVIKHADANAVKVKLKQTKVNIRLEISDNGQGFDTKNVNQFGLGLQNMRSRAEQIGAKIKIRSVPEKGTKIIVLLRLENRKIESERNEHTH